MQGDKGKNIIQEVNRSCRTFRNKAKGSAAGRKALSSTELNVKSVFIIAGTREEFANEIKERMERLFQANNLAGVIHDSKHTECYINNTKFKVFPTKRLKDVRGYIDVAYLFIDEGDFDKKEQDELKYVIKSYEEKSKGKIILVSTAGASGGLFETIENDPNSDFKKLFMLVNRGRGKIFDDKFLDEQKEKDPAFYSREYEGRYGYGMGNCFLYEDIETCCALYRPTAVNSSCTVVMGIDPGFGSSNFAISILMLEDSIIKVLYSKEWNKPSYEEMVNLIPRLKMQYRPGKIFVDSANPEFIKSVKSIFNEATDYDRIQKQALHDKVDPVRRMYVVPVSFSTDGKLLLERFQHFVSRHWFSVSQTEHKDLVTQMRMAKFQDNGN